MARHTLAPYYCNRTSIVRPGHTPRDDKGKAGRTKKLPSHMYKTLDRRPRDNPRDNRSTLRTKITEEAPTHTGEHPGGAPHYPPIEATIENPNASVSQPTNRSRDVMRTPLEPDVVSSDSTNSVREQLCQVNQRLNEVQRDFVISKEEVRETTKGGSPFAPEILDKPIPSSFRLPTLEPYDGSTDMT
ncbi:hypothetical protein B296_00007209 [Ensete ventricosum]|uniref:Uncharacterized protein n=1 Tax=Ensete ventricosum TaxID=4639 RepID=A0A426YLA2_ENSVE|nr:hypothetical protein B296_00007209 [Ensete ventricosum]